MNIYQQQDNEQNYESFKNIGSEFFFIFKLQSNNDGMHISEITMSLFSNFFISNLSILILIFLKHNQAVPQDIFSLSDFIFLLTIPTYVLIVFHIQHPTTTRDVPMA